MRHQPAAGPVLLILIACSEPANGPPGQTRGIDGLYWHRRSLVAVQNHRGFNRVARFALDPEANSP